MPKNPTIWTICDLLPRIVCNLSYPSCKLKGQLVNSVSTTSSANSLDHIWTCSFIWIQIPSCAYKYGRNCSKSKFSNWWKHFVFRTRLNLAPLCLALTAKSASISFPNFFNFLSVTSFHELFQPVITFMLFWKGTLTSSLLTLLTTTASGVAGVALTQVSADVTMTHCAYLYKYMVIWWLSPW